MYREFQRGDGIAQAAALTGAGKLGREIRGYTLRAKLSVQGFAPEGLKQIVAQINICKTDVFVPDDQQSAPEIPSIDGQ
ncbi:protein of unknown function [Georgfuchsia toluolica]|uniref:Uncharacterized protein n=1 Tax=Georgfuchsia toluolica TaxID=424218 RepID=A0A916J4A5_9PROT|nr:protein of unknown function [Georgfuchsia toluolica]